jgi:hypothetical protein
MAEKLKGECLCGQVRLELTDPAVMLVCHCTRCQRWSGGGGSTVFAAPEANLAVTAGTDRVSRYSTEGFGDRLFCATCGSSLYATGHGQCYVGAGAVRTPHAMVPSFNMMVAEKLPWEQIADGTPQFPELPPQS